MAHLRVPTNRLRKGMTIKNNVYSRSGAILVPADTPVSKEIITLLTRHFIDCVVVEYQTKEIPIPPVAPVPGQAPKMDEQSFSEFSQSFEVAEELLSNNLKDIASTDKDVDIPALLGMLNQIVEKSENSLNLCDMLSRMKETASGLYAHSINVALFSQILATWMNFEKQDVERTVIAALLHDIGLMRYSANEMTNFTFREELEGGRYDKHVIYGYNLVKDKNLDSYVKQAVLTHHERLDGKGFPLKVTLSNINRFSRVLSIADTYESLTTKEEGKDALSPFDALRELEESGHHRFDSQMLMTFISKIAHNFIQHTVLLNTGEKGQIVLINKYNLTRPLVQVGSAFLDLATRNDLYIKKLLD